MARISEPGRTRLSGSYGDFAGFWMGSCNGLVGGPRVTPPCLRLLEPVALAVQLQNMDMMREAIEKRASETLADEDGAILTVCCDSWNAPEGQIRGHHLNWNKRLGTCQDLGRLV